ncbi:MAG: DUF1801 domain-containing protein [Thaumarchaeota archaeon]|nr:DUF1801 domain-containing protein [Nitrososphaerota archaeon]
MNKIWTYGIGCGGEQEKSHMSLHIMSIYGSPKLRSKYEELLPGAKFQKGCINFTEKDQMPLPTVRRLLEESAAKGLSLLEAYQNRVRRNPQSRKIHAHLSQ